MKSILKPGIGLPMAVMLLALALGAPSTAQGQIAISGSLLGQEKDTLQGTPPQKILVDGSLTGVATQLGLFTITNKVTVNLDPAAGAVGTSTGSAQLTASNGDTISAAVVGAGQAVPGSPTLNSIVEVFAITGGTGRFRGATGHFTVERLFDTIAGTTAGTFKGTIRLRDDDGDDD